MRKVYLLDGDSASAELAQCTLGMNGIRCDIFQNRSDFYVAFDREPPDAVILEWALPDGNGSEVLKHIKEHRALPCVVYSKVGDEVEKVKALELGAEDYIVKPFGVLEFAARIKVVLRRLGSETVFGVGSLLMNEGNRSVIFRGKPISLNNKEFHLLKYFVQNEGKVMTREAILTNVWGYDYGGTRTLDNHIARLRRLGLNFETVFGVGYRFLVDEP